MPQHTLSRKELKRDEFRESFVRKVPDATHDPLFHRPRIGSAAQHFDVMVRFHDQHIRAAQVVALTVARAVPRRELPWAGPPAMEPDQ